MSVNSTQILAQLQKIARDASAGKAAEYAGAQGAPGVFETRLDAALGRSGSVSSGEGAANIQQAAELLQLGTMRRSLEQLSEQPSASTELSEHFALLEPKSYQGATQLVQSYLQNLPVSAGSAEHDGDKGQPLPDYEPGPKAPEQVDSRSRQSGGVATAPEAIEQVIVKASQRYGVDAGLIRAVIKAESDFNPRAVSHAGAQGLMQLMPATARGLGVRNPFDIEQNVMAGTRFLKGLLDRYNGDLDSALAAYNWGPGNVDRRPERLPRETRDYLVKVKQYYVG